ncbi:MAG: serine hydrolase domain-containing protein [Promethearchaeota archaeon]|jgi:CubicO group peptidase (beta-lactamase class C family)
MSRKDKDRFKQISLPIIILILGIGGVLPGWILLTRLNSQEYWTTIIPELVQMDSDVLSDMIDDVENQNYFVYSIIVIRNGFIVTEWYSQFTDRDYNFRVYSVSKSVTSALIGIAIDKGYIESINEFVLDYFPDKNITNIDPQKESITIEHLLTMTTGLHWPEYYPYEDNRNPYNTWKASGDHVKFVLDRQIVAPPGLVFNYNTGASHLLTAILERATNMSTMDFANKYLFRPLFITDADCLTDPQGVACGGDGVYLTARSMAKIGQLFLKDGNWEGKQIISRNWVRSSTTSKVVLAPNNEYGYQWWINPDLECFRALGYGQQQINVFPEKQLIVVFTGMNLQFNFPLHLLNSYILPATM